MLKLSSCEVRHVNHIITCLLTVSCTYFNAVCLILLLLAMIFLRDSLCLSAVTLSRQRHYILDFSNCPLSRVLHVTLANWQGFGFEFHLRSSPS